MGFLLIIDPPRQIGQIGRQLHGRAEKEVAFAGVLFTGVVSVGRSGKVGLVFTADDLVDQAVQIVAWAFRDLFVGRVVNLAVVFR